MSEPSASPALTNPHSTSEADAAGSGSADHRHSSHQSHQRREHPHSGGTHRHGHGLGHPLHHPAASPVYYGQPSQQGWMAGDDDIDLPSPPSPDDIGLGPPARATHLSTGGSSPVAMTTPTGYSPTEPHESRLSTSDGSGSGIGSGGPGLHTRTASSAAPTTGGGGSGGGTPLSAVPIVSVAAHARRGSSTTTTTAEAALPIHDRVRGRHRHGTRSRHGSVDVYSPASPSTNLSSPLTSPHETFLYGSAGLFATGGRHAPISPGAVGGHHGHFPAGAAQYNPVYIAIGPASAASPVGMSGAGGGAVGSAGGTRVRAGTGSVPRVRRKQRSTPVGMSASAQAWHWGAAPAAAAAAAGAAFQQVPSANAPNHRTRQRRAGATSREAAVDRRRLRNAPAPLFANVPTTAAMGAAMAARAQRTGLSPHAEMTSPAANAPPEHLITPTSSTSGRASETSSTAFIFPRGSPMTTAPTRIGAPPVLARLSSGTSPSVSGSPVGVQLQSGSFAPAALPSGSTTSRTTRTSTRNATPAVTPTTELERVLVSPDTAAAATAPLALRVDKKTDVAAAPRAAESGGGNGGAESTPTEGTATPGQAQQQQQWRTASPPLSHEQQQQHHQQHFGLPPSHTHVAAGHHFGGLHGFATGPKTSDAAAPGSAVPASAPAATAGPPASRGTGTRGPPSFATAASSPTPPPQQHVSNPNTAPGTSTGDAPAGGGGGASTNLLRVASFASGEESSMYSLAHSHQSSGRTSPYQGSCAAREDEDGSVLAAAAMDRAFTSTEAQMALYQQRIDDARMQEALQSLGIGPANVVGDHTSAGGARHRVSSASASTAAAADSTAEDALVDWGPAYACGLPDMSASASAAAVAASLAMHGGDGASAHDSSAVASPASHLSSSPDARARQRRSFGVATSAEEDALVLQQQQQQQSAMTGGGALRAATLMRSLTAPSQVSGLGASSPSFPAFGSPVGPGQSTAASAAASPLYPAQPQAQAAQQAAAAANAHVLNFGTALGHRTTSVITASSASPNNFGLSGLHGSMAANPNASMATLGGSFLNNASLFLAAGGAAAGSFAGSAAAAAALRDPLAASVAMQQNRAALIAELKRRRLRLHRQLGLLQKEATARNVFALVRASNASQLQYLLQEGLCNVNDRDYNGCTPLHVAAGEGNQAIVRVLLSFGADVVAVDNSGRTPLDCAAANRHSGVGRYLLTVIRNQHLAQGKAGGGGDAGVAGSVTGDDTDGGRSSSAHPERPAAVDTADSTPVLAKVAAKPSVDSSPDLSVPRAPAPHDAGAESPQLWAPITSTPTPSNAVTASAESSPRLPMSVAAGQQQQQTQTQQRRTVSDSLAMSASPASTSTPPLPQPLPPARFGHPVTLTSGVTTDAESESDDAAMTPEALRFSAARAADAAGAGPSRPGTAPPRGAEPTSTEPRQLQAASQTAAPALSMPTIAAGSQASATSRQQQQQFSPLTRSPRNAPGSTAAPLSRSTVTNNSMNTIDAFAASTSSAATTPQRRHSSTPHGSSPQRPVFLSPLDSSAAAHARGMIAAESKPLLVAGRSTASTAGMGSSSSLATPPHMSIAAQTSPLRAVSAAGAAPGGPAGVHRSPGTTPMLPPVIDALPPLSSSGREGGPPMDEGVPPQGLLRTRGSVASHAMTSGAGSFGTTSLGSGATAPSPASSSAAAAGSVTRAVERPVVAAPAYLGGGVTEFDVAQAEDDDDGGGTSRRGAARRPYLVADGVGGGGVGDSGGVLASAAVGGAEQAEEGEGDAAPLGEAEMEGIESLLLGRRGLRRRDTQPLPRQEHARSSASDSTPSTPLATRWRSRSPQTTATGSFPGEARDGAEGAAAAVKSMSATAATGNSCTPPTLAPTQSRVRQLTAAYQRPPRPHTDALSPDISLTAPTAASAASTQTATAGPDVSPARMLRPLRLLAVDGHDPATSAGASAATTAQSGESAGTGANAVVMESGSAATSTLTMTASHATGTNMTTVNTPALLPSYNVLTSQDDMTSSAFMSGTASMRVGFGGGNALSNASYSHNHRDSINLHDMGQQSLEEQHHHYRMAAFGTTQQPQPQQQPARGTSASPTPPQPLLQPNRTQPVAETCASAGGDTRAAVAGAGPAASAPAIVKEEGGSGGGSVGNRSVSPAAAAAPKVAATATATAAAGPSQRADGQSAVNISDVPARAVPVLLTPNTASPPAHSRRATEEQSFLDEVLHEPVDLATLHHSSYTTVCDTVSIIVCMVGLPGRGKSFISKRLVRYMNWKGVPCKVFNAGNYRRQLLGVEGTAGADFFDPNNPQGAQLRERMAELACEDLLGFIGSHALAVGILDATNTTRKRRAWLRDYFQEEAEKRGLPYRLLFIESVCTDDTIVTENILRSKCDNDDFKNVKDVNAVIAEFRSRILQYEKVYETLEPDECMAYIKIINVKHHVMLHRVPNGLGSRIAFFLLNLHPIAFPIYVALPGENVGDSRHVYGGEERLTGRGEAYAVALKNFIQDRYVPHMVVLHATNYSVLSTLAPLMGGASEDEGAIILQVPGSPVVAGHAAAARARTTPTPAVAAHAPHAHDAAANTAGDVQAPRRAVSPAGDASSPAAAAATGSDAAPRVLVHATPAPTTEGRLRPPPGDSGVAGGASATAPASREASHASHRHPSTPKTDGGLRKLHPHSPNTSIDELRAMAGGDLSQVPHPSVLGASTSTMPSGPVVAGRDAAAATERPVPSPSHTSLQAVQTDDVAQASPAGVGLFVAEEAADNAGDGESAEAKDVDADGEDEEEEEELGDEVLCPVPGLDNINFGRFSGHTAGWVKEKYPRLSALLYDVSGDDNPVGSPSGPLPPPQQQQQQQQHGAGGSARVPTNAAGLTVDGRDGAAAGAWRTAPLPPPVHYATHEEAAAHLQHAPSGGDPRLSYCIQFPNGESCRQVNVRLEPALMAVMRTQSPVFVVAPAVPAQGILSFFMDVIPELSPTIRIPGGCVVEIGVKNTITVHPLLPDSLPESMTRSPLTVLPELQEAIREAAAAAAAAAAMEKSTTSARAPVSGRDASPAAEAARPDGAEPATTSAVTPAQTEV